MDVSVIGNTIELLIDDSIYGEDVLHKCFYWYGADYRITISRQLGNEKNTLLVSLKTVDGLPLENAKLLIERIERDLIDFKLRDIVTKETQTVRELIVAKAFAYYDIEENPLTEVTDPVGFNPQIIVNG